MDEQNDKISHDKEVALLEFTRVLDFGVERGSVVVVFVVW
jgi:hypothetical protein